MIRVRVLDGSGHTELLVEPKEAMQIIEEQSNRWVFVDGEYVAREDLTPERLERAEEVLLTCPVVGG